MKSVLIELDEAAYETLKHIAKAKRLRAEFIGKAIRKTIRQAEDERVRQAYLTEPVSEAEADDSSTAEACALDYTLGWEITPSFAPNTCSKGRSAKSLSPAPPHFQ